jgi:heme exporter protein B
VNAFATILKRDLRLAARRWGDAANPLIFFVIVAALFRLAMSPGTETLTTIGIGVVWVSALLSSLLALEGLFRADAEDGSIEQLMLSPVPLGVIVFAKIVAHWIISSLPLIALAPLVALAFGLPPGALPVLLLALLLATPALSVLIAIGAALTVSLKAGSSLIGLLVLPLTSPLLIFGARATDLAAAAEPSAAPLYLLAALAVLGLSLGPIAVAAALKVGLE